MNGGKIFKKFLGHQLPSGRDERIENAIIDIPQLRPSVSQDAVFNNKVPVTCLDRSPDGSRAVIAGQDIFKILKVDGTTTSQEIDLRSVISSYATSHNTSAASANQLNIEAVQWSHSNMASTIITASGNGRITLYDLNKAEEGLEVVRIHEHNRQVHKIAISPHSCNWLLSASHDGTVKLFDLRTPSRRNVPTFKCNSGPVWDVKCALSHGHKFACATENGSVQQWDWRGTFKGAIQKIHAHQGACLSIAYHPDKCHIVSGGMDKKCYVWDISGSTERVRDPKHTINAASAVANVSWRPACWSATANNKRAAQVAVAYHDQPGNQNSVVHLWDLARPTMPFKEIEHWDSSPTGLLWHTLDLLWTTDKDGHFTQTDLAFVPNLMDRHSLSTFGFSSEGDLLMLLEERQQPRRPRPAVLTPEGIVDHPKTRKSSLLAASRSDSEEDVIGSFLGPRQPRRRRHDERSHSLSTTPPNATTLVAMPLDEAIKVTGNYKPQQIMALGQGPSTTARDLYEYFTGQYLLGIRHAMEFLQPKDKLCHERLATTMEHFAKISERIAQYRLAQTWRILAHTMNCLLTRRAEHHRKLRMTPQKSLPAKSANSLSRESPTPRRAIGQRTPKPASNGLPNEDHAHAAVKSIIAEDMESKSNVATPLARPVREFPIPESKGASQTLLAQHDIPKRPDGLSVCDGSISVPIAYPWPSESDGGLSDDILKLPDALSPSHGSVSVPIPVPGSNRSDSRSSNHATSNPSTDGFNFYGPESFSPRHDFSAPPRRQPLRLNQPESSTIAKQTALERHDSGESFQMFSTSGDSQSRFMSSSGSDRFSKDHDFSLQNRDSISWSNSLASHSNHRSSIDSQALHSELSENSLTPGTASREKLLRNGLPPIPSSPPTLRIQEASFQSADLPLPVKDLNNADSVMSSMIATKSDDICFVENDYLPWPNDPQFVISPLDPAVLVQREIEFQLQSGVLNASAMILLLRNYLPDGCIDDLQAGAVLTQFHDRLMTMRLVCEAASLRNLCVPRYPEVFTSAQDGFDIGLYCVTCKRPQGGSHNNARSPWRCSECRSLVEACPICQGCDVANIADAADRNAEGLLWVSCLGCTHGGHRACMMAWHAGPDGKEGEEHSKGECPVAGCFHPCIPGEWYEIMSAEAPVLAKETARRKLSEAVKEGSKGEHGSESVLRDAREVNQSRAVENVRLTPMLGPFESRKSVKVVAPGDKRSL